MNFFKNNNLKQIVNNNNYLYNYNELNNIKNIIYNDCFFLVTDSFVKKKKINKKKFNFIELWNYYFKHKSKLFTDRLFQFNSFFNKNNFIKYNFHNYINFKKLFFQKNLNINTFLSKKILNKFDKLFFYKNRVKSSFFSTNLFNNWQLNLETKLFFFGNTIQNNYIYRSIEDLYFINNKSKYQFIELENDKEDIFKILNENILINMWSKDINYTNSHILSKNLLHIKYIQSLPEYYLNDLIIFFHDIWSYKSANSDKFNNLFNRSMFSIERSLINIFYRIKRTIHFLRIVYLEFFKIKYNTTKHINMFFFSLKHISVLNYIWFLEYNCSLFLIKIKFSNSIKYSRFLFKNNLFFNNNILYFSKWTFFKVNTYNQLIICLWTFYKILKFFKKLNMFLLYIDLFYETNDNIVKNFTQIKKKYSNNYTFKYLFFKYIEIDYKILTFILLPIISYKLYYNYILLMWFNYWNHRVVNWKFLS